MVSFKASLVRTIGIAAVASGLLLSSAFSAFADTRTSSYTTLAYSPPPPSLDLKSPTMVRENDVIIGDITPERRLTTASGDLKAGTTTARGGTTGLGAADDFKAGAGCSIQCITSGVAYARGVGANLVVRTDTPATIWIIVWNDDGYHKMVNSAARQTQFAHHFDDLEPGTTYQAMAAAEDVQGFTSHGYGHFTTLTRTVQVSFTHAVIHEKPYNSSFNMKTWLQGEVVAENFGNAADGDTVPLGIHFLGLDEAERYVTMQVLLLQSDPNADLCEAVGEIEEPSIGSADCTLWAYAEFDGGDIDVDDRTADATSWTHHTIQTNLILPGGNALPGGYGQPLNFHVPVSIEVTYE